MPKVELSELETIGPLGKGSFGQVSMVKWKGEVYARKQLSKYHIFQARQVKHVIRERQLLGRLDHPFIVNLKATASDATSLYMVLELVQGGELWSLIYNENVGVPVSSPNNMHCSFGSKKHSPVEMNNTLLCVIVTTHRW